MERICCTAAILLVALSVMLLIYYSLLSSKARNYDIDNAPHEWYIERDMWLFDPLGHARVEPKFDPLMLVIVDHTVSPECHLFVRCAAALRILQTWFLTAFNYDIPYNFIIGNDGRVYEVRGWKAAGDHTYGYNQCSIGIGFIGMFGDYREEHIEHTNVTELQLNRTQMILAEGVKLGLLRHDYLIVGAKDLRHTVSPGSNLHTAIKQWPNFDHKSRFKGLTCEQIHKYYANQTLLPN